MYKCNDLIINYFQVKAIEPPLEIRRRFVALKKYYINFFEKETSLLLLLQNKLYLICENLNYFEYTNPLVSITLNT